MIERDSIERFFDLIVRHDGRVLAGSLLLTALLAVPLLAMQPARTASSDPQAEVFETQDLVEERFQSSVYAPAFIVEARDGDILRREPLLELLRNSQALRASEVGDLLVERYDPDIRRMQPGLLTLADAVDAILIGNWVGGLEFATEDQVKIAVSVLLEEGASTAGLRDSLSADRTSERRVVGTQNVEIDYWTASALLVELLADNEALGGGSTVVALGSDDTTLEQYSRDAQALLRGEEQHYRAWGIAIDVNLTSADEGATAGPFIGLTIVAVLLVVGVLLRSYWAVATVGAGLAILVIWLKGLSNLVGLDRSLTLDLIVPIAMISFGVDFAFHALGRYREERDRVPGLPPARAYVVGLSGVVGALILALVSDSVAFLSNVTAGIPTVVQFGIGATVALAAAFIVLGVLVPLVTARIEVAHETRPGRVAGTPLRIGGAVLASLFAGAAVLTTIVVPAIGVLVVAIYIAAFVALPMVLLRRCDGSEGASKPPVRSIQAPRLDVVEMVGGSAGYTARAVGAFVRARSILLPAVLVATALAAVFAVRVEAAFDVKDFFSADGNFATSLDKLDEHVGDRGGEPALLYVESDLTQPEVLRTLDEAVAEFGATSATRFAREDDGRLVVGTTPSDLARAMLDSETARHQFEASTRVTLSDEDGDGLPDTPEQLAALFRYASDAGIALDADRLRYTPDQVRQVVWINDDGDPSAARLVLELPGTRAVENIEAAQRELEPFVASLTTSLASVSPGSRVASTGGPFTRQESLNATYRALQLSLPIAIALCLLVVALFMRSLRYALASIVPILLVVVWLYAFMYGAGFTLNFVTATIGAISIGVGIDYAIHFTVRFREELGRHTPAQAAERAAGSTGNALVGSALSSVVGFAVMAFAPMPLFATYGLLTAVMILLAATAALVVLPPLLVLITPEVAVVPASDVRPDAAS